MGSLAFPIVGFFGGLVSGNIIGCSFGIITTFTKAIKRVIIFSVLGGGVGLGIGSYLMMKN